MPHATRAATNATAMRSRRFIFSGFGTCQDFGGRVLSWVIQPQQLNKYGADNDEMKGLPLNVKAYQNKSAAVCQLLFRFPIPFGLFASFVRLPVGISLVDERRLLFHLLQQFFGVFRRSNDFGPEENQQLDFVGGLVFFLKCPS